MRQRIFVGMCGVGCFLAGANLAALEPSLVSVVGLTALAVLLLCYALTYRRRIVPLLLVGGLSIVATPSRAQEAETSVPWEEQFACYPGWHEVSCRVFDRRCCEPIPADSEQCKERTTFECSNTGHEFTIASHVIACGQEVRIHNERCAATVAAGRAQQEAIRLCHAALFFDVEGCANAQTASRIALDQKRRVFEKTERPLHAPFPAVDGGGGVRLIF